MKVTDYNEVWEEVETQLQVTEWSILNYVSLDVATMLVTNIYITSDIAKGFGQDIPDSLSVISSADRISVIANGCSSFFKSDGNMCLFESLSDDVEQILMILDAALVRIETRS